MDNPFELPLRHRYAMLSTFSDGATVTYRAWDGKDYEGEPPTGWYLAADERWWGPGTGPSAATPATTTALIPAAPTAPAQLAPAHVAGPPPPGPVHIHAAAPPGVVDARRVDVAPFHFDGGAATYVGTAILATLITVCSLGIAFPFAYVLRLRWRAKHTYIEGRRLIFTGTGMGLFGNWIKWFLLIIVTFGIYSFWVQPRLTKWAVERQAFDPKG